METIFDHGATIEDLDLLWEGDFSSKTEYMEFLEEDQQAALSDIVRLAKVRGDDKLKVSALARIENPDFRRQLAITHCLEAGHRLALDESLQEKNQAA
jgi:hypothetical protein